MLKTFMRESIDLVPAGTSRNQPQRERSPGGQPARVDLRSPVDKDQGYH
jgi:hypothetical protein